MVSAGAVSAAPWRGPELKMVFLRAHRRVRGYDTRDAPYAERSDDLTAVQQFFEGKRDKEIPRQYFDQFYMRSVLGTYLAKHQRLGQPNIIMGGESTRRRVAT